MLFTIIALVAVAAIAIYVAKKTKSTTPKTSVHVEETIVSPSIHEEIAKTVEETKNLAPVTETAKPAKKKPAPKTAKVETPAPTMSAKKKVTPKAKK